MEVSDLFDPDPLQTESGRQQTVDHWRVKERRCHRERMTKDNRT
jgi:hypothetical protein